MKITHEDCGDGYGVDIRISSEPKAFDNFRRWSKESNLMGMTALRAAERLGYAKIPYTLCGGTSENQGSDTENEAIVTINVEPVDFKKALEIINQAKAYALSEIAIMMDPKTYID